MHINRHSDRFFYEEKGQRAELQKEIISAVKALPEGEKLEVEELIDALLNQKKLTNPVAHPTTLPAMP